MHKSPIGQNDIPEGLCPKGRLVAQAIVSLLEEMEMTCSGGCTPFYSPQAWKARGEKYGLDSVLIVCHDGGDLAEHFGSYPSDFVRMREALKGVGCYSEQCTSWYTAILPR